MVSQMMEKSINDAKAAVDTAEQLGRTAFDIADGILTNSKAFVHDDVVWKKINEHEEKVHKEFTKRIDKARKELEGGDPLYAWEDGMEYYLKLRRWKTLEMLSFWDQLSKDHDL